MPVVCECQHRRKEPCQAKPKPQNPIKENWPAMSASQETREMGKRGDDFIRRAILTLLKHYPDGLRVGGTVERLGRNVEVKGNADLQAQLKALAARGRVWQPRGPRTAWAVK